MNKKLQCLLAAVMISTVVMAGLLFTPPKAEAACAAPRPNFSGFWTRDILDSTMNKSPISAINIRFNCGDQGSCPIGGKCIVPWTGFYINLKSGNTFWGEVKARRDYYYRNKLSSAYFFSDATVRLSLTYKEDAHFIRGDGLEVNWRIEWRSGQVNSGTTTYYR